MFLIKKLNKQEAKLNAVKMKVRLPLQIFSESAAKALGMPDFEDCADTADYLHAVNNTFVIWNSNFPFAYGSKPDINNFNYDDKIDQLQCAKQMLNIFEKC